MGSTARGVDWPAGSEFVGQVRDDLQSLAQTADAAITTLANEVTANAVARSRSANLGISNGPGWQSVFMPTTLYNDGSVWSYDGSDNAIVTLVDCLATFHTSATFASDPNGSRSLRIVRLTAAGNFSGEFGNIRIPPDPTNSTTLTTSWPVLLQAGQKIRTEVRQNSGGNLAVLSADAVAVALRRS